MATTKGICACGNKARRTPCPRCNPPTTTTLEYAFVGEVLAEVKSARAKFPDTGSLITGLALGEESGEAQRALLHIWEGKGDERQLYLECVQTAAMALRLALELEDRVNWKGNVRRALRDSLAAIDGE